MVKQQHGYFLIIYLFVGNKAKGRILKWVVQENKARQIFRKTNIFCRCTLQHEYFPRNFVKFSDEVFFKRYNSNGLFFHQVFYPRMKTVKNL